MPKTMTYTGQLVIVKCWCGIQLAVPSSLYAHAQESSENAIYCPLGHTFVYRTTEADRERERAELAERRLRSAEARATAVADQLDAERRSSAAYRGWITRYRNRIASGVCPVDDCRRNFANVARHIERMHPTWAHEHPEALA